MNFAVCVPWTGGDRWRQLSQAATQRHWEAGHLPVFLGVDEQTGEWPNRAAARNDAIRQALAAGADVVLLADSDTEVSLEQANQALTDAHRSGCAVFAFDEYVKVRKGPTSTLLTQRPRARRWQRFARADARTYRYHCSGALAVPASAFATVGMFDERFTSWGCEDRAFLLSLQALVGPVLRIPGPAWHWWHPKAPDRALIATPHFDEMRVLARRYRSASGLPDAAWPEGKWPNEGSESIPLHPPDLDELRTILTEHGGPLNIERAKAVTQW